MEPEKARCIFRLGYIYISSQSVRVCTLGSVKTHLMFIEKHEL